MTDRVTFLESEGVQFLPTPDGRLCWIWEKRSSLKHYGETFEAATYAAEHFIATPEGHAFVMGYGVAAYHRGKQHAIDDFKRLHAIAEEQAKTISRLARDVTELRLARAQREAKTARARRLFGALRKLAPVALR